ncbi:hypothetical protein BDV59DRAFT_173799 [Aspergillus ambiguus]|uniref:uncharacterized protein n=1 Tax=Aspergillus ambiguus TaxID=176160 RepID=UPI003CCCAEEF
MQPNMPREKHDQCHAARLIHDNVRLIVYAMPSGRQSRRREISFRQRKSEIGDCRRENRGYVGIGTSSRRHIKEVMGYRSVTSWSIGGAKEIEGSRIFVTEGGGKKLVIQPLATITLLPRSLHHQPPASARRSRRGFSWPRFQTRRWRGVGKG